MVVSRESPPTKNFAECKQNKTVWQKRKKNNRSPNRETWSYELVVHDALSFVLGGFFSPTLPSRYTAAAYPSIFRQDASPLYGIVLISYIFLLRIFEASSITASDIKSGRFGIRAAKRNRAVCWRQSTTFVDTWLSYLQTTLRTIDSFDRQILTDTFSRICAVF